MKWPTLSRENWPKSLCSPSNWSSAARRFDELPGQDKSGRDAKLGRRRRGEGMTTLIWQPHLTMAAAQAAGLEIGAVDIEILPRPHKQPGRLPVGKMAVHVFSSAASAAITMRPDVR
jgi:hypothetical protein